MENQKTKNSSPSSSYSSPTKHEEQRTKNARSGIKKRNDYKPLWLIVVTLFYAPLAFGATTPLTLFYLDALLFSSFAFWLIQLLLRKQLPLFLNQKLPSSPTKHQAPSTKHSRRLLPLSIAILAILAIAHLLNPASLQQSPDSPFLSLKKAISWLPGSLDFESSLSSVIHFAALGGAFFVLLDLTKHRSSRWLLLKALAISGFVIAVIGIVQKASGAEAMLWATPEQSGTVFFGAFRYHANSASFLNLSWPAALALWLKTRKQPGRGIMPSIWLSILFFTIVAVFVNSSKAGQLLGLVGLVIAFLLYRHTFLHENRSRIVVVISLLVGLTVVIISIIPNIESSIKIWDSAIADGESLRGRLLAYRTCIRGLPDSGLFGTGPGTFRFAFPEYNNLVEDGPTGYWYHAHQDYLQTLIEWGFLGATAWLILFAGAIRRGLSQLQQSRRKKKTPSHVTTCSLLALLLVLLHALVDFPLQIPAIQLQVSIYLAFLWNAQPR